MAFWKKLLIYLIGVGLGVLLVIFIFGDRNFTFPYFPNARVLQHLRDNTHIISADMQAQLDAAGLDTADIHQMLLKGDVDFSKSEVHNEGPCHTYWVDYEREKEKSFSTVWKNCDTTATLVSLEIK